MLKLTSALLLLAQTAALADDFQSNKLRVLRAMQGTERRLKKIESQIQNKSGSLAEEVIPGLGILGLTAIQFSKNSNFKKGFFSATMTAGAATAYFLEQKDLTESKKHRYTAFALGNLFMMAAIYKPKDKIHATSLSSLGLIGLFVGTPAPWGDVKEGLSTLTTRDILHYFENKDPGFAYLKAALIEKFGERAGKRKLRSLIWKMYIERNEEIKLAPIFSEILELNEEQSKELALIYETIAKDQRFANMGRILLTPEPLVKDIVVTGESQTTPEKSIPTASRQAKAMILQSQMMDEDLSEEDLAELRSIVEEMDK